MKEHWAVWAMNKNERCLQIAYILHRRPFRETSMILDVLTREQGRISLIAKGVRTSRSKWRSVLQPFSPLLISWRGKTELMTLLTAESQGHSVFLQGDCLNAGFYLNELLIKLFQKCDPHPALFDAYESTIQQLASHTLNQKILRLFEKKVLEESGYGLQFKDIKSDMYYRFYGDVGFMQCELSNDIHIFSGTSLLALSSENLNDIKILKDAKRLLRLALAHILGSASIQSRKLFVGV